MKKKLALIGLFSLFIINLPGVLAQGILGSVWDRIIEIGNLSFLGIKDISLVTGFLRILVGILVFAIFFAIATKTLTFLKRNQAIVVSAVLATISAIFMPAGVLLGIGAGWGTAVALILIGGPILGVAYLLYKFPETEETRFTVFIKLMLCFVLLWILTAMKFHIGRLI